MADTRLQEMVGREKELSLLVRRLEEAADGKGSLVLISGEAGIGKTRLVEEFKAIAQSKGFLILSASCFYESLTPYMPFLEALRFGGLEHLFVEETPRVEGVYLVTPTGLLVSEFLREETRLDPDIFAAMLTTVGGFMEDSLALLKGRESGGSLNRFGYEGFTILIARGRSANLSVIVTGRENEFLLDDMREAMEAVDRAYGDILKEWDGDDESVRGVEPLLEALIRQGKYDGISYGREDPKARRNLLFENVALGLARRAQASPILLCLEDLQWADPSTLALLHHVARTTRECWVALLGTYRPEDLAGADGGIHPLVAAKERLDREGLSNPVELHRLDDEETAKLVRSFLGVGVLDADLERKVYAETEGNPLFVLELVQMLVEKGVVRPENRSVRLVGDLQSMTMPTRVRDVLAWRLMGLERKHREILECAAVCGEEFQSDVLAEALGMDRAALFRALWTVEQKHGLLRPRGDKYRFDHVKIREALYEDLPEDLRKEYHANVARATETLRKDADEAAGEIAFHLQRSRQRERALPYLLRAAEWTKKQYANAEAIRFYREALDTSGDSKTRREIFQGLAAVYALVGESKSALEANRSALELSTTPDEKATILSSMAKIHQSRGESSQCERLANEALSLIQGQTTKAEAAALNVLGLMHESQDATRQALEFLERGLAIWEKLGDEAGMAAALNNMGNSYVALGDSERALECYGRAVQTSERIGHLEFLANHLNNIGVVHYYRGDLEKALQYYGMSRVIKEKVGNRTGAARTASNMAQIYAIRGELMKAVDLAKHSVAALERLGEPVTHAHALMVLGIAYSAIEDDEQAYVHLARSAEVAERIGNPEVLVDALCRMSEIDMVRGNAAKALELADRALPVAEKGVMRSRGELLRTLGIIYRKAGRAKESEDKLGESLRVFRETGDQIEEATVRYEMGLTSKEQENLTAAMEHLQAAIEVFERVRALPMLTKARRACEEIIQMGHPSLAADSPPR